jgi:hypothetical protein
MVHLEKSATIWGGFVAPYPQLLDGHIVELDPHLRAEGSGGRWIQLGGESSSLSRERVDAEPMIAGVSLISKF